MPEQRGWMRFAKGAVAPAIVVGLLYLLSLDRNAGYADTLLAVALCGIALGVGWPWVRGTFVTKWAGRLLALYVGLVLVLFSLGISLAFSSVLFLPFLLALPVILYDLFVQQPHKGRFARARAERRGTLQD